MGTAPFFIVFFQLTNCIFIKILDSDPDPFWHSNVLHFVIFLKWRTWGGPLASDSHGLDIKKGGAIHMPNKACKTAPNLKIYLIPSHLHLSQSRKMYFPLQAPIHSLLLGLFCITTPVEAVYFNKCVTSSQLSVTSCRFPHFSHNFYVFLSLLLYKKSPPVFKLWKGLTTLYLKFCC